MKKPKGLKPTLSEAEMRVFAKKSRKEQGKDVGGDPDAWDEKNIQGFIDLFDKAYPGLIDRMSKDLKVEIAFSGIKKDAVVSKDSDMRKAFWLPGPLQEKLELGYPSFWTNAKHARWFCRHFPQFAFETYTRNIK